MGATLGASSTEYVCVFWPGYWKRGDVGGERIYCFQFIRLARDLLHIRGTGIGVDSRLDLPRQQFAGSEPKNQRRGEGIHPVVLGSDYRCGGAQGIKRGKLHFIDFADNEINLSVYRI